MSTTHDATDAARTAAIAALVDAMADAVAVLTADGVVLHANDGFSTLLRAEAAELRGARLDELTPPDDRGGPTSLHRHVAAALQDPAPRWDVGVGLLRSDGTSTQVSVRATAIDLEGDPLTLLSIRDAPRLREATDALVRLARMQDVFLRSMSHELRTPLAIIRGFTETMRDLGDHLDEATRADYLSRVCAATDRFQLLLDDLAAVHADHGAADVRLATVTADDVGRLVQDAAPHAPGLLQVEVGVDVPTVLCDRALLRRSLKALLTNAHKYAPGPCEVAVTRVDDGVRLVVDDHGPGVAPELRDAVFEPFARGAETDGSAPGLGIGLTLLKGLAASLDGRAWVTDRDDGDAGASFRLWLPAATAPTRPPAQRDLNTRRGTPV